MSTNRSFTRVDRLNKVFLQELSKIFLYDISDKRFAEVSITAVKMSRDIKVARVYFVTSTPESREKVEKKINKLNSMIRSVVAQRVSLKRIPNFIFTYDEVFEEGLKIDKLLKEVSDRDKENN